MSEKTLTQFLLLPDLRFVKEVSKKNSILIECVKTSKFEVCPHCAKKCTKVYDHVYVHPRDEPIRNKHITLRIKKRRFRCEDCKRVFREPVAGVFKGFRTTERFRRHIRLLASEYQNLKQVSHRCRCSSWLVYKAFYQQIELELRKTNNPWPKTIGIDEHSFIRNVKGAGRDFVTVFIDYTNKRMREVVMGKSIGDLLNSPVSDIKERENVKNVILDLSPTFRSFAKDFFPNAKLIADKFHVVKLMHPLVHKYRQDSLNDYLLNRKRTNPVIRLLLRYRKKLRHHQRSVIDKFLALNEELSEVYWFQQRLYALYRIKGYNRARERLLKLLDDMGRSQIKEIQSYRLTLKKWFREILNYFSTGLNNGRTEGYNRKAKLVQRNAYGFRSFTNYRLKLLYSCR